MKFFKTPHPKNMIETLRIVTIEKPGLKFLLILKFHGKIDLHTELTSGTSIILFESKTEKKSIKIDNFFT